jgi:membrane protein required for colicin V production
MNLTALDILVIIAVVGSGVLGFMRGFVTEVLSLFAWVGIVIALKLFHAPVAGMLAPGVGTVSGAAVLAFAIVSGIAYFGGRLVANAVGNRTRTSILGPLDRALGLAFGGVKGLIFVSLAFLLVVLVVDTMGGGREARPEWMTKSRTYPLLDATSAKIADFVDRRRRGESMFGTDSDNAADAARAEAGAQADNMIAGEGRRAR